MVLCRLPLNSTGNFVNKIYVLVNNISSVLPFCVIWLLYIYLAFHFFLNKMIIFNHGKASADRTDCSLIWNINSLVHRPFSCYCVPVTFGWKVTYFPAKMTPGDNQIWRKNYCVVDFRTIGNSFNTSVKSRNAAKVKWSIASTSA